MGFLSAISNLPGSDDGAALGSATLRWSDLFLASGSVINWDGGDVTLTHSANTLTLAGGTIALPDGTAAAPSLRFPSGSGGFYWDATASLVAFAFNSALIFGYGATTALRIRPTSYIEWANGATLETTDVFIIRDGAASLQMGEDSATPIAQAFKGPDARAGTDTNAAGGDMTIAPGRSTGTAAGGVLYLATSPKGATGTAANALVNRVQLDFEGIAGFSPQDAAATPVEPTGALKMFAHNKSVVDDGIVTLPAITTNAWGTCVAGDASVRTQFVVDATGTVTLVNNTASVVANADTDTNLCIGTAGTQEPLQIKNRLGAVRVLNIVVWYD